MWTNRTFQLPNNKTNSQNNMPVHFYVLTAICHLTECIIWGDYGRNCKIKQIFGFSKQEPFQSDHIRDVVNIMRDFSWHPAEAEISWKNGWVFKLSNHTNWSPWSPDRQDRMIESIVVLRHRLAPKLDLSCTETQNGKSASHCLYRGTGRRVC